LHYLGMLTTLLCFYHNYLLKKIMCFTQEKAARAEELARNSIRWVMGPTGTVVSFPDSVGLPSIFNSKPCRYPIILSFLLSVLNVRLTICSHIAVITQLPSPT
jgi:hypothetical protein